MRFVSAVLVASLLPGFLSAQDQRGYYRFPASYGETVVFASEGDLWSVNLDGGLARRLTTHPGDEARPAFSPDGDRIAFSATYEGPQEVYVMPATGGLPQRLTYEGEATVVGWTPDGRILYATSRFSTLPNVQLAAIDPATGARDLIPLAQAAEGSYEPRGETLFFTRFAMQGSRTKRYKGGTAQNIWRFTTGASEAEPLTPDYAGTSRAPMWWDGRVYFESDRDGTMNLWSMDERGGDLRQHTRHVGWDVKSPSLGDGKIVYQLGADLRVYDIATGTDREIPVRLASDFDQTRERWVENPMEYLSAWYLSPNGDRLALTARGKVFVAPVDEGRFVEATRQDGVRYRSARFLPDGESLIVLSDESDEVEWWRLPANGIGEPEQITSNGRVLRFTGVPSPDGKWIAHRNQDQELWLTNLENKTSRRIAFSPQWGFEGPAWSPDNRWVAYGKPADNSFMQLYLYSIESGESTPITTDRFNSRSPAWSPDGNWIYFLSDRNFRSLVGSPWGSRQPEPYLDRQMKLYALALEPGTPFPFAPSSELAAADDTQSADTSVVAVDIALVGIERRIVEVPVDPGNYANLTVTGDRLFFVSRATGGTRERTLMMLAVDGDDPEAKAFAEGIRDYELSADGKKIGVRKGNAFYVVNASSGVPAQLNADARVDLSGWTFSLDPREDWRQLFVESWRLERDYFYDPNMHGVDWEGMLEKYLPLVDRVGSRAELADLQSQMAAELSALHTFVYGGDHRDGPEDVATATLGARLERDEDAGGYRVAQVYRADPDLPDQLSPLARYGVGVRKGDVIEAINGVSTLSVPNAYALLRNQAGEQVRLRIRPRAGGDVRDVIVRPISASRDADLRYDEWEYTRRLAVDSMAEGAVGYVHLRAMGSRNIEEWYREFYPVFDRQGLIIDVRHNRGGNIESWILEKLLRRVWMYWQPRVGDPYWNMQYAFRGHVVVLVDERTASDGEAFAEGFRRLGLGQIIGTRTWGGEIWLTSSNRLADRGIVTAAEFGVYSEEGEWLIEGHGVEPDIVVDNLPHATFNGKDAQLAAAVQRLQALIREDPRLVPPPPAYPDKSSPDNRRRTTSDTGSGGAGR